MKTTSAFVVLLLVLPYIVFARKLAREVEHAMAHGAEAKICLDYNPDEFRIQLNIGAAMSESGIISPKP